ncbi:MAG TPA: AraC family transcriptional regulator [Verrucomicrobiae bacterium]|nr:AraC family transcriptional regulator [Verrucomicrobiae bacterium]
MLEHARIFESSLVRISDVHCRSGKAGCGETERETSPRVVLPKRGAFAYHFSRHDEVVADANTAVVLHPQMEFKVSHPIDGGDCCTVFEFDDDAVLGSMRGAVQAGALAVFAARLARLHAPRAAKLAIEEHVLACLDALAGRDAREAPSAVVERAKAVIAHDPFDNRSLLQLAREVGVSPYHLTRAFRRATGLSLHAYRMQLRLQAGLERASSGEALARVAVDCGFAHHSHFTSAFRRHFGTVPSQLRKISIAS